MAVKQAAPSRSALVDVSRNGGFLSGGRRLLDQPEEGERIAIVLAREGCDRERLRRPRHQLLDKSRLAEGGPKGEIVIACLTFWFAVGVVEADEIRPVRLHLGRKLLSARSQRRRLDFRSRGRRGRFGGAIRRPLQGLRIEQILQLGSVRCAVGET